VSGAAPSGIGVRMYQVGFGDSFLVSFHYDAPLEDGRDVRHVLFDFGSTSWPKLHEARYTDIADDVAAHTAGALDAVVITHRHKDHLGGFGNKQAAAKIASLRPKAVVRPWTENPTAAAGATGPAFVGERSFRYARSLDQAQAFAEVVAASIDQGERGFRGNLRDVADEQLKNKTAIKRLDDMAAATANKGDYVFAGSPISFDKLLPGVKTTVLGPPTIDMWPEVAGEKADDPEYWLRQRGLLGGMLAASDASPETVRVAAAAVDAQPIDAQPIDPGPLRWIIQRLHDQQTHSLLRIVGGLEDAMNNTSVILLFQVGKRTLLFPGDAQIENWSYCLTSPKAKSLRAALPDVDFYKVGHHGSRNASPRSLVAEWGGRAFKLSSMMSTLPDVHGETEATAVPRKTLVDALKALGPLFRTDDLKPTDLFKDVSASTADTEPFAAV
jgi:metal-dependent hydrolase (beta-lactamase superfamily II)